MLRNTCNHHANGRITESQIFIYNRGKEIPLTYLLHLHCACISINIITGLACIITKSWSLFIGTSTVVFNFVSCFVTLPLGFFQDKVGVEEPSALITRQFYSLSSPRMGCYRSDHLYCSCICEIQSCHQSKTMNSAIVFDEKLKGLAVLWLFS